MSYYVIIPITEKIDWIKNELSSYKLPGLHISYCTPIDGEEISSDEKTDGVTDHNDHDNKVIVVKVWCLKEWFVWIKLRPDKTRV